MPNLVQEMGGENMTMTNTEKLNSIIGKLLDQVDTSLDNKEAPKFETLEALRTLVNLTSSTYQIDGKRLKD
ncbi:MAG: hypothetical protein WA125_16880 [Desulfosporosinus sp.]